MLPHLAPAPFPSPDGDIDHRIDPATAARRRPPAPRPRRPRRPRSRRSLRRRLRRTPLLHWATTAALALAAFEVVDGAVGRQAEADLGALVRVAVAARPLAIGEELGAGDVRWESWPEDVLPRGQVVEDVVGRTVATAVLEGDVLVAERLSPAGVTGVAALVPSGWRAVAIPSGLATPPVRVGDRVDLLATFPEVVEAELHPPHPEGGEPEPPADGDGDAGEDGGEAAAVSEATGQVAADGSPAAEPTFAIATGAIVVDVGEEVVTVAVRGADVTRVTFASVTGTVSMVIGGAPGDGSGGG